MTQKPTYEELEIRVKDLERECFINKQSEEALGYEIKKFGILYDLAIAMTADRSLNENLQLTVDKTKNLLGTDTSYIALRDDIRGDVYMHSLSGIRTEAFKKMRLPFGKGFGGLIAETRQGYIIEDYFTEKNIEHVVDNIVTEEGVISGMGVPIQMGYDNLGVLYVFNRKKTVFSQSDLDTLFLIGNIAAVEISRKRMEKTLRESEERLLRIVEGTSVPVFVIDKKHSVTHWNRACEKITGISANEVIGTRKQWSAFYSAERPVMADLIVDGATEEEISRHYVGKYRKSALIEGAYEAEDFFPDTCKSGRWLFFTAAPLRDRQGNIIGSIETLQDTTNRKSAEDKIKESLKEKETLLSEIHHRVKNNMQVISSLLNLQAGYVKDEQALELFRECQNRVRTMALIHERLYQAEDLASIDFADYIRSLAGGLLRMYRIDTDIIKLNIYAEDVFMDINTSIPCGLIINELVSNAFKHAFPEGREGEISITFKEDKADNRYTLIVSDDGASFPVDLDFRNTETLGMQLVNILTEQLHGTIEIDRSGGTSFEIVF